MSESKKNMMIHEMPLASRPRERLTEVGAEYLADQELLAIILRTGYRSQSALHLALNLLRHFQSFYGLKVASLQELQEVKGVGLIKAIEIKAMIELGGRLNQAPEIKQGKVVSSQDLGERMIEELRDLRQEHLVGIYLDTKNQIIKQVTLFIGGLNQSVAHPREIFKEAVRVSAASLILVHNHPSGNPVPSQADIQFTQRVAACGQMMGIDLLDHLVVGEESYISLREMNIVESF